MRFFIACFSIIGATLLLSAADQPVSAPAKPGGNQPESLPELRKLLADPKPLVRLQAALALVQRDDEQAIGALIDLLGDLPHAERLQAEHVLQELAGAWSPSPALRGDDELSRKIRREAWAGWWRTLDGPALLALLRQRTLEMAANEKKEKLPPASARLLAIRKPAGAAEALLAYLPFTDDYSMKEEIGKALKNLVMAGGKPDAAVIQALSDPLPVLRLAAAEALIAAGGPAQWPAIRKLLTDADLTVRLRVAVALVNAQDREAVPTLFDLIAELPRGQAWEVEQLLHQLAGDKAPEVTRGNDDAAARKKLREVWQAWWKDHGAAVNLPALLNDQIALGVTVVAEFATALKPAPGGKNGGAVPLPAAGVQSGRLVALDRNSQPRWQMEGLDYPIDFQMLPGGRALIAEYQGKRVTERDSTGKVLWEVTDLPGAPTNVQRLANGNTFIALYAPFTVTNGYLLLEVNREGKTVATFDGNSGVPVLKGKGTTCTACKMADGKMVCLATGGDCIRLDAAGKLISRFAVPPLTGALTSHIGNIDGTSKGHIVIVQDNHVAEYDADGKIVWQANAVGNRATRLANGNTLVASETAGVVELDNAGKTVWQYQPPAGFHALRARQVANASPAIVRKLSAADALKRQDIPASALARLGTGKGDAPKELVAVLGRAGDPQIVSLALTRDGRTLVTGGVGEIKAQVFDLTSGKLVKTLSVAEKKGNLVAISPDGATVAMTGDRPTVQVVDTATGQLRSTTNSSGKAVNVLDVVFSPDGKTVGLGDNAGMVILHDLGTGVDRTLAGHALQVTKVSFSPDGKLLASASGTTAANQELIIWETATGKILGRLKGHTRSAFGLAWHPNGKILATGSLDGSIRLWDMASMTQTQLLRPNGPEVHSLAWHPGGDFLASHEHTEGTIALWDLRATPPSPRVIRLFPADVASRSASRYNNDVLFTPEGRHLIAGNADGTASVLRLAEIGELLK